jgi:signal peptidase
MRRTTGRRIVSAILSLAVTIGALGFLALAVGPHVLGYRTAVMLTGSMTGTIDRGDIVVSVPRPTEEVEVGDILTFQAPVADRHVETHRVIAVRHPDDGRVEVRTQGDANAAPDPWRAAISDDTVWETAYVVPEAGHVVQAVRSTVVRYGAVWVALVGVVLLGLSLIWRQQPPRHRRQVPAARPRLTLVTSEHRA